MIVYIVMGHRYNGNLFEYENSVFGVCQSAEKAELLAKQQETADETEGYNSNFFWVETWEII